MVDVYVATSPRHEKKVINGKIADYDGVSLYPSAINRLCRDIGLPTGKAIRLTPEDDWKTKVYSILTVRITKVNKHQQMPFIAHKGGVSIEYSNEAPAGEIVIDSITLEDYIKFHEIEYEIVDGIYWIGGTNGKLGELVQKLFAARLEFKKTNPTLANVIKLMLNSGYGKTIMKKGKTEIKIVNTSTKVKDKKTGTWVAKPNVDFESYVYNNFNTIKSYRNLMKLTMMLPRYVLMCLTTEDMLVALY